MKEKIYHEYGLDVEYFIYKGNHICFNANSFKYILYETQFSNERLEKLNIIVNYLDNYAIFFHQIVLGKKGYIFNYGDTNYVLLKLRIVSERRISLDEVIRVSSISVNLNLNNSLEEKIDFLEQYLANYENLNFENINYFIGLSENSISLFNLIPSLNNKYINHRRIKYDEKAIDFYNPLNIVLDYKTRDIAEYAKSEFVYGNDELIDLLNKINPVDWYTYFARILFPSIYFDVIDDYINSGVRIDKKRISALANSFEKSIKNLYNFMNNYINMPHISWLSNIDDL